MGVERRPPAPALGPLVRLFLSQEVAPLDARPPDEAFGSAPARGAQEGTLAAHALVPAVGAAPHEIDSRLLDRRFAAPDGAINGLERGRHARPPFVPRTRRGLSLWPRVSRKLIMWL